MNEGEQKLYDVDPEWSPERKEAFGMYRDMGAERNLRGVAQALHKSSTLLARWSSEDKWRIRVAAWDAEQDRVAQKAAIEERERITKKHARAIESTITVLMQPAEKLATQIEEQGATFLNDADPIMLANLSAQVAKTLPALVQASRLVHGFSTSNVNVNDNNASELAGASPEELDAALTDYDDGADEIIATDPTRQLPSKSSGDEGDDTTGDDVIEGTAT